MAALLPIDTLRRHAVQQATVAHDIVGRLRVVVPQVQDDPQGAATLCGVLRRIDGVTDVRANPSAASVTVLYDAGSPARAEVLGVLGHPQPGHGRLGQAEPGAVAELLTDAVAKHLADAAVRALLAALV